MPTLKFQPFTHLRLFLVCFLAVAVALPIAMVGLAKLLVLLAALWIIASGWLRRRQATAPVQGLTSVLILSALFVMTLSSLWSAGATDEIAASIAKHGKLLLIPVLLLLIRSRREALLATACFVGGQLFLLASTWLLFLGVALPWVLSKEVGTSYAVFSSYLDQSIMTAVLAGVAWHLRAYAPPRYRTPLGLGVAVLALIGVFFIFQGRTGHLVALALLTLALAWEIPRRFRLAVFITPLVLLALLAASSSKVQHGLQEISGGVEAFSQSGDTGSSSGTRLNFWLRSLEAIAKTPLQGTGVGSWSHTFNAQQAHHVATSPPNKPVKPRIEHLGNPHQEYLLWTVELGVIGTALLCAALYALYRDSRLLETPARRAFQSILAALALACLFNSVLYDALIGDFFCVALGLLLAWRGHTPAPSL